MDDKPKFPVDVEDALEQAIEYCARQIGKPDVYDSNTLQALSQVSALAAFLRIKGAEYTLNGERAKGTYLKANDEALDKLIASLKFKINAHMKRDM